MKIRRFSGAVSDILFAISGSPVCAAAETGTKAPARSGGMDLDLNDYYCSCNLPRLYRQRNRKGDEERAQSVLAIVIAACERAKTRGNTDEWLRPTLLGAAFDAGNADKAEELAGDVAAEGAPRWKLDSILNDLESSILHVGDNKRRERLTAVIATLKRA